VLDGMNLNWGLPEGRPIGKTWKQKFTVGTQLGEEKGLTKFLPHNRALLSRACWFEMCVLVRTKNGELFGEELSIEIHVFTWESSLNFLGFGMLEFVLWLICFGC